MMNDIEKYNIIMISIMYIIAVTQLLTAITSIESTIKVGIARFTVAYIRFVVLFRAETVEEVISSMDHIEKANEYRFFNSWLGLGLLTRYSSLLFCISLRTKIEHFLVIN